MGSGESGGSGGSGGGQWSLIESDPGVFTELIREFGVKGLEVEELWSLAPDEFERLQPIHGLIFLFRWGAEAEATGGSIVEDSRLDKIFFARQVTENACATQAVVNLLMNCNHPDLELGTALTDLRDFCTTFDPFLKGLTLTNSPLIRTVHNSFARQTLFECDAKVASDDNEAYHFVGYIPIDGRLYELDGLRPGPIDLGAIPSDKTWIDVFREVIKDRIDKYSEGEIHFNLMALVSDRKMIYERQLAEIVKQMEESGMETDEHKKETCRLQMLIDTEVQKHKIYQAEIARRKHNYLAFIVELLKILAKEGKLMPLYEKAKEKAAQKMSFDKTDDKSIQKAVRKLDI